MTHEYHTPLVFHHPIIKMGHADRFTDDNVDWVPLDVDGQGRRFRNEKDGKHERFLSHGDIYRKLSSGVARLSVRYNDPGNQKLRAIFGDTTFAGIKGKKRALALFRQGFIKRFDAERLRIGKKPRWDKETFEANLRAWRKEILKEMIDIDDESEGITRADQETIVRTFSAPSIKTFRRDYARYHAHEGEILAIVHRHHGPGLNTHAVDPDSLAFAYAEALRYKTRLKPRKSEVYRDYLAKLADENSKRPVPYQKIARYKFEQIIDRFDKFDVWEARNGRPSALKHFTSVKRGINVLAPGQRVEFDFWNVELVSLFAETGMWDLLPKRLKEALGSVRIWFVAAIDVATRYLLAFKASLNPNAVTATAAIRMAMSDKRHISTFVGAQTPWVGFVQIKGAESDNGTEFANERTDRVMSAAGIGFSKPPAGDPQKRPFVESLFHTLGPLIAAYFDGRTFGSIAEKGDYNPEDYLTLEIDELIKVFIFAICDIYHNKPHSGLGGRTPHNAWVRATQEHEIDWPSQDPLDRLNIFGERFTRRIGKYGIPYMGIPYGNEELHRQRAKYGQIEFNIRVDPENLRSIAVEGDEGWFEVENLVGIETDLRLDEWMIARRDLRRQNALESESGLDAMYAGVNRLRELGVSSALRADLSPRARSAQDLQHLEGELFGAWEAVKSASSPVLIESFTLPSDPLREGKLPESTPVQKYHADRKKSAKEKRAEAKEAAKEISVAETPDDEPSDTDYYGGY